MNFLIYFMFLLSCPWLYLGVNCEGDFSFIIMNGIGAAGEGWNYDHGHSALPPPPSSNNKTTEKSPIPFGLTPVFTCNPFQSIVQTPKWFIQGCTGIHTKCKLPANGKEIPIEILFSPGEKIQSISFRSVVAQIGQDKEQIMDNLDLDGDKVYVARGYLKISEGMKAKKALVINKFEIFKTGNGLETNIYKNCVMAEFDLY